MTGFLLFAVLLLAFVGLWVVLTTNSFIRARNKVDEAWSGIDVQLKRRHDLVASLVDTVRATPRTSARRSQPSPRPAPPR